MPNNSSDGRIKLNLPKLNYVMFSVDLVLLSIAFYVGVFSRWATLESFRVSLLAHSYGAVTFTTIILTAIYAVGLYSRELEPRVSVISVRILVALFLSFLVFSVLFYMLPGLMIWRSALAIAMTLALLFIVAWRYVLLRYINLESIKFRILTIGCGAQAAFIEQLESKPNFYPFRCVGYVHLRGEQPAVPIERILPNNRPLLDIALEHNVREIVVATDEWRNRLSIEELMRCKLAGIRIWDYLSFREHETGSVDLQVIRPSWFVFSGGFPGGVVQQLLKRVFDILVGLVSFVFFFPLFCATALAIRLESAGPIFHLQERIGLNGKPFIAFKFRSMSVDAEAAGTPRWAQEDDPRVTTIGRFIRRTRIDEIPQIVNVLRGDMSFVGPRPERPYFVDQLVTEIPYYHERHRVKPGITGWAQLNYIYGASIEGAKEKLQYDLYYVKHYSIILDLLIILQTVRVILWPKGVR